ncbi:hypothetical protein H9P43_002147 [Blastocladiella emersonii ATCC 22665]|nr:hypothetical protein H9P43_002147 [Blastocladiella emersonii ATCC 22665]
MTASSPSSTPSAAAVHAMASGATAYDNEVHGFLPAAGTVLLTNPSAGTSAASRSLRAGLSWLAGAMAAPTAIAATSSPATGGMPHWPAGGDPRPPPALEVNEPNAQSLAALALQVAQAARATDIDQSIVVRGTRGQGKWSVTTSLVDLLLASLAKPTAAKRGKVPDRVAAALSVIGALATVPTTAYPRRDVPVPDQVVGVALELHLDDKHRVAGAQVLDYALDATALASFPIFHQLLAGATADQRRAWHLPKTAREVPALLTTSAASGRSARSETAGWTATLAALKTLGFSRAAQDRVAGVLAAILHLASIEFADGRDPETRAPITVVADETHLVAAADLLGLPTDTLRGLLVSTVVDVGGTRCARDLTPEQAVAHAMQVAQAVYSLLFTWILEFINTRLGAAMARDGTPPAGLITVVAMPDMRLDESRTPGSDESAGAAGGVQITSFWDALVHRVNAKLDHFQADALRRVYGDLVADELSGRCTGPFDWTPAPLSSSRSLRRAFPDDDTRALGVDVVSQFRTATANEFLRELFGLSALDEEVASPDDAAGGKSARGGNGKLGRKNSAAGGHLPNKPLRTPSVKRNASTANGRTAGLRAGAATGSVVKDLDASVDDLLNSLTETRVCHVVCGWTPSSHALVTQAAAFPRHGAHAVRLPLSKLAARYAAVMALHLRIPDDRPLADRVELLLAAVGDADRLLARDAAWISPRGLRVLEAALAVHREWKRAVKAAMANGAMMPMVMPTSPYAAPTSPYGGVAPMYMQGAPSPGMQLPPLMDPAAANDWRAWVNAQTPTIGAAFNDAGSVYSEDDGATEDGASVSDTHSMYDGLSPRTGGSAAASSRFYARSNAGGGPGSRRGSNSSRGGGSGPLNRAKSSGAASSSGGSSAGRSPLSPPPDFAASVCGMAAARSVAGGDAKSYAGGSRRGSGTPSLFERMSVLDGTARVGVGAGLDAKPSATTTKPAVDPNTPTAARRRWLVFVWLFTFLVPPFALRVCGMRDRETQMAWREKVAICWVIFLMSAAMLFAILFAGMLVCPPRNLFSFGEMDGMSTADNAPTPAFGGRKMYAAIRGRVYNLAELAAANGVAHSLDRMRGLRGWDLSAGFALSPTVYCKPFAPNASLASIAERVPDRMFGLDVVSAHTIAARTNPDLQNRVENYLQKQSRGLYAVSAEEVKNGWNPKNPQIDMQRRRFIVQGVVYDLTSYMALPRDQQFLGSLRFLTADGDVRRVDDHVMQQAALGNYDLSGDTAFMARAWNANDGNFRGAALKRCMDAVFAEAVLDERLTPKCLYADWILLAMSAFMVTIIAIKFLASLLLPRSHFTPENMDKFVMMQVPCYTEDEDSMRKTLHSLATLNYDDKRKLIVVLCDGMIVGRGNDRPTPHIVLDVLGIDPATYDLAPALAYESVGEGPGMQTNMARVYSGLYEIEGRLVPFVVVVKCGKPTEVSRPGNRGKRDSQMILMRFLNRLHMNKAMTPLEHELRNHIERIIGVDPKWYEYMLMVDADTTVDKDSLNQLVAYCMTDTEIVGVCGETKLANEKDSFTTMIQPYEYFISHHLSKAFESVFGTVTCLPGCFCMYRIFSAGKTKPLLVHDKVVDAYADTNVNTLHKKNLLALGEDRYLTTLVLSVHSRLKTKFTPSALAYTTAPEKFSVLLSQRRRWINSTIHNLLELLNVKNMCGFCCFSMRWIVGIELLATLVQPAMVVYLGYLIYLTVDAVINNKSLNVVMISFIMLAAIYGAQAVVFILKREFAHIVWMFIYILAIPLYGFLIPLYSFWRQDEFSWGHTARVNDQDPSANRAQTMESPVSAFDEDPARLPQWTYNEYLVRRAEHDANVERALTASIAGSQIGADWENASAHSGGVDLDDDTASLHSVAVSVRSSGLPVPPMTFSSGGYAATSPHFGAAPSPRAPSEMMMLSHSASLQSLRMYATPGMAPVSPGPPRPVTPTGSFGGAPSPLLQPVGYGPPATGSSMTLYGGGGSGPSMAPVSAGSAAAAMPTEDMLTAEICRILQSSDLMQVTKKGVRAQLEGRFGVDLSPMRGWINTTIDQVLDAMAATAAN